MSTVKEHAGLLIHLLCAELDLALKNKRISTLKGFHLRVPACQTLPFLLLKLFEGGLLQVLASILHHG